MSTVGLKLASLVIRTLSKPIANRLKSQAREHPRFRRVCINIAQTVHRTDMTLRLNLLRDSSVLEREELAEKKAIAEKRAKETAAKGGEGALPTPPGTPPAVDALDPTVPAPPLPDKLPVLDKAHTPDKDAPIHKSQPQAAHTATETTPTPTKLRIRPLSESKAVDRGATFISELFLFAVAGGLILFESIRSRRKEANRRDLVAERLEALEIRDKEKEERIIELERELWVLGGKKGEPKLKEWTTFEPRKKSSKWFGLFGGGSADDEVKEELNAAREKPTTSTEKSVVKTVEDVKELQAKADSAAAGNASST